MAIHFNCKNCGKALFAQDRFAGQPVKCPGCQTANAIPFPGMLAAATAGADAAATTPADQIKEITAASVVEAVVTQPRAELKPAVNPDATKICPMCAETIKAAAKKCRYCNTILDEELKVQEERRLQAEVFIRTLSALERNTNAWRLLGMLATVTANTTLILMTIYYFSQARAILTVFNLFLIFGFFWSTRQMRRGPASVFAAAAFAILACMPLNFQLGLPVEVSALVENVKQVTPGISDTEADARARDVLQMFAMIVGMFMSAPVWIAALKVAALERLKSRSIANAK